MKIFEASDIVNIAIRIEEDGYKFYRHAAEIARDESIKKLFNYLAKEEQNHKVVLKQILATLELEQPAETVSGEYCAYLRDYVDNNIVFTTENKEEALAKISDTISALTYAIRRELDSILYYHEAKRMVPESQHKAIDTIIAEERHHFEKLSSLLKQCEESSSEK